MDQNPSPPPPAGHRFSLRVESPTKATVVLRWFFAHDKLTPDGGPMSMPEVSLHSIREVLRQVMIQTVTLLEEDDTTVRTLSAADVGRIVRAAGAAGEWIGTTRACPPDPSSRGSVIVFVQPTLVDAVRMMLDWNDRLCAGEGTGQ